MSRRKRKYCSERQEAGDRRSDGSGELTRFQADLGPIGGVLLESDDEDRLGVNPKSGDSEIG
jgi:hypothetical protein